MKKLVFFFLISIFLLNCKNSDQSVEIVTTDIDNYWNAYDKIVTTKDTVLQQQFLKELFIDKATEGQKALFLVRNYQPREFIENINKYPKYWNSIRNNMSRVNEFSEDINNGISELREVYPKLKSAKIYFGVGAFRTPGTILDSLVLIGSEYAFSNENIDVSEFSNNHAIKGYSKNNKLSDLDFLNVHEFIHTQQFNNHNSILLKTCLYEGIPEFISEIVMNKKSVQPSIKYGFKNSNFVKAELKHQLFSKQAMNDWLWNSTTNRFKMRDVGYYVGYAIAKGYYDKASDKKKAIQKLIDLDFSNEDEFNSIIDKSGYFNKPILELKKEFQSTIPRVIGVKTFKNGSQNVDSKTKIITVEFSKPMQPKTGFDLGPLGIDALMRVKRATELFTDKEKRFLSFEVDLESNKHYQLVLGTNFRTVNGLRLQEPYLIDFKTAE